MLAFLFCHSLPATFLPSSEQISCSCIVVIVKAFRLNAHWLVRSRSFLPAWQQKRTDVIVMMETRKKHTKTTEREYFKWTPNIEEIRWNFLPEFCYRVFFSIFRTMFAHIDFPCMQSTHIHTHSSFRIILSFFFVQMWNLKYEQSRYFYLVVRFQP